jgi:hypothetical protein
MIRADFEVYERRFRISHGALQRQPGPTVFFIRLGLNQTEQVAIEYGDAALKITQVLHG